MKMSKWEILYSYLTKMYWGHGKFGIESASLFYFGKHHSLLNVGESALLARILPSPETFNPLTNPARAKNSQARVLRRMVASGFIDFETALLAVSQPLYLHTDQSGGANKGPSSNKAILDWKMADMICEARENMENWAMRMHASKH
ncbi:hypothetical protein Cni_G21658 [Canna indica]|uniref:Glycosyl transferase family 51 domain-containing protein n=1 Tax=Canna indica TaxID=4628 RepID=A0AAQ3KR89_9LILI|nr:hypothetical protein Cni_G21658 [Canna indica]